MFKNKEYVLSVYREGSFTKAAKKLYVSQPSLSATIKRIEDQIESPLFDRSTSPITLTEVGKEYVNCALDIEQKEKDFDLFVSDYTSMLTGNIKIGGTSLFSSYVLPKLISNFNLSYPQIRFELYEDSTKYLMHKLSLGELDIVIDNVAINDQQILPTLYSSELLVLAVPKSFDVNDKLEKYRLTAEDVKNDKHKRAELEVSLKEFKQENFILLNPENDTGKRATNLFKKHDLSPKVSFYLDQQVTAYNLSCSGLGITFVSDTLIKHTDATPDLYFYRLSDKEMARNLYLYQKKNKYLSLAARKFVELNTEK